MGKRPAFVVLTVLGSVAWLGGLLRLFAEAAGRLLSAIHPEGLDASFVIIVGIAIALTVGVLGALLPWYRQFYRQTRLDAAALRGMPVESLPTPGAGLQRSWRIIAAVLGGAIALALLLPGPLAAAVAIVAGLALRLTGTVVAAVSAPGSTSP